MEDSSQKVLGYCFGPFELDPAEGSLARNGTRVKLQGLPYRLLVILVERAERSLLGKKFGSAYGRKTHLSSSITAWAWPSGKCGTPLMMMPTRRAMWKPFRGVDTDSWPRSSYSNPSAHQTHSRQPCW